MKSEFEVGSAVYLDPRLREGEDRGGFIYSGFRKNYEHKLTKITLVKPESNMCRLEVDNGIYLWSMTWLVSEQQYLDYMADENAESEEFVDSVIEEVKQEVNNPTKQSRSPFFASTKKGVDVERVLSLYREGLSQTEIATKLETYPMRINKIIKDNVPQTERKAIATENRMIAKRSYQNSTTTSSSSVKVAKKPITEAGIVKVTKSADEKPNVIIESDGDFCDLSFDKAFSLVEDLKAIVAKLEKSHPEVNVRLDILLQVSST